MTLVVNYCAHDAAAFACRRWHYSGAIPMGKLIKVGAWEQGKFIGAVIFGRGANNNIGGPYNLSQDEVCELVRVALSTHEAPVSQIVAAALRYLREKSPGLRLIVSYADPAQGHHGGIYQAGNWIYTGPSRPQRAVRVSGRFMHKRVASARWGTASPERLRALTGRDVEYGPIEWKHTYLMPLDKAMRRQVAKLALPFPKHADEGSTVS